MVEEIQNVEINATEETLCWKRIGGKRKIYTPWWGEEVRRVFK